MPAPPSALMAADQTSPQVSGLYFGVLKMQLHIIRTTEISLHGEEMDTMCEILKLAHKHLCSAPLVEINGVPLELAAGLADPDLFRVKTMLQEMGDHFGVHLSYQAGTI